MIEVMVSMVLMALAAIFSMLVIKVVAQRQAEIRSMTQYTLVTKSLKSGFDEYMHSVDSTTIPNGQVLLCVDHGALATGKNKMTTLICNMEAQLIPSNGAAKKTIVFTTNVTLVNDIHYFSSRVQIRHTSCPSGICLDRILVNQK